MENPITWLGAIVWAFLCACIGALAVYGICYVLAKILRKEI